MSAGNHMVLCVAKELRIRDVGPAPTMVDVADLTAPLTSMYNRSVGIDLLNLQQQDVDLIAYHINSLTVGEKFDALLKHDLVDLMVSIIKLPVY